MRLEDAKVLTLVSDDFDDLEFFYPMIRLKEAHAQVDVAALSANTTYHGKYGLSVTSDIAFKDVDISTYDALLIPGGWAPDALRRIDDVLEFVRYMDQHNRVIGQICHAGWVLSSAGILKGRHVTSTPGIKHDLMYAGATWSDVPAIKDGNLVSGRRPPDLPIYLPYLLEAILEL